jgi:predicted RNase H-like HicB family nuclease
MINLTLTYWIDDGWYVGKFKEVPSIFSQGETLDELIENIKDAYNLMLEDEAENIHEEKNEILVEV